MKLISTIALLAALAVTPVLAQTSVSTGVSTGVGGGVSVEAGGSSVGVDAGVSVEASASASADTGSNASSNGSSNGSNSGDGSSSMAGGSDGSSSSQNAGSNGSSSSQEPMASGMTSDQMCSSITNSNLATAMIDAAALEAVTSVTVFSTTDCSGLTDTVAAGADMQTNLRANALVMEALQAQGNASSEIVGYVLDGTSLTVFVRNK